MVESAAWEEFGVEGPLVSETPYTSSIGNYYRTDPISRSSRTMLECTKRRSDFEQKILSVANQK